jgi:hypothetical protein
MFLRIASGRWLMRSTPSPGALAATAEARGAVADTGGLGMASYSNMSTMACAHPQHIGNIHAIALHVALQLGLHLAHADASPAVGGAASSAGERR